MTQPEPAEERDAACSDPNCSYLAEAMILEGQLAQAIAERDEARKLLENRAVQGEMVRRPHRKGER